ncbi:hypothetical protein C8R30_11211 [Nitrosomonas nitrosa]|uniref:Uncharacterized protein n=1 Tax=Nitrosomonas nitrosa TaxID=52442 RepID=A0A1I4PC11_9PROT|nr:hypothetical protein C8R30_11211 [Nitrosomonas nitrosa]SFM25269.1 hypothetical protein SAMN05421880_11085 [Nitrosomonas nitrosa]
MEVQNPLSPKAPLKLLTRQTVHWEIYHYARPSFVDLFPFSWIKFHQPYFKPLYLHLTSPVLYLILMENQATPYLKSHGREKL